MTTFWGSINISVTIYRTSGPWIIITCSQRHLFNSYKNHQIWTFGSCLCRAGLPLSNGVLWASLPYSVYFHSRSLSAVSDNEGRSVMITALWSSIVTFCKQSLGHQSKNNRWYRLKIQEVVTWLHSIVQCFFDYILLIVSTFLFDSGV